MADKESFVTYRRADGQSIEEYDYVTDTEWFENADDPEPVEVIKESWTIVSRETVVFKPAALICEIEDADGECENDGVDWHKFGDVWMQVCEKHNPTPTDQYDPLAAKLHATTDAQVWAQEFVKLFRVYRGGFGVGAGEIEDTEGLMIGWFANAIEVGRSAGRQEAVQGLADTLASAVANLALARADGSPVQISPEEAAALLVALNADSPTFPPQRPQSEWDLDG